MAGRNYKRGCVYVLELRGLSISHPHRLAKIGCSSTPEKRIAHLRTPAGIAPHIPEAGLDRRLYTHEELCVVATRYLPVSPVLQSDATPDMYSLERATHATLKPFRLDASRKELFWWGPVAQALTVKVFELGRALSREERDEVYVQVSGAEAPLFTPYDSAARGVA